MRAYPLSNAQKRIWYTQQKYKDSCLFNIGGMVRVKGKIDIRALEQAILNTILSNAALNFRFFEKNNQVFQYVCDEKCIVDFIDFSCKKNGEEDFKQWYQKKARTPFLIINKPLYYFSVFKISNHAMGYFVKLHHIIADGWSIKLMTDQIAKGYEDVVGDGFNGHIEKPSYIDFVLDEEIRQNSEYMDKAKHYWKEMFTPLPESASISPNHLEGRRLTFIPAQSFQMKIEQYIKKHNVSLNTFLNFIYIIYTYKKLGLRDIILGVPLLGRKGKVERQTFGVFTNTMPYRYILDENEQLADLLKKISIDLKRNMRHQNYPYNLLHEELRCNENGIGRLYNTCINYYNTNITTTFGRFEVENTEFYNGEQEYELQIIIRHWNDIKLQLDFDYQTSIYSKKQIKDMYHHFILLMNQLFQDDTVRVKDLLLIDNEEKIRFINTWNQTKKEYPADKTWLDLFHKVVCQKPDLIAVSKNNESLTYQELNYYSNMAAGYMISVGVKKGDLLAVLPQYDIQSIIAIVAIMKCGGVYLPIDISTPIGRINEILHNSEAKYYIAGENHSDFNGKFISFKELATNECKEEKINLSKSSELAYIIYTSGSTGTPKGVIVTHKNLVNYLWWAKNTYLKQDKEVFALYSSFAFDFTMTSIFLPLISGNEIRIYGNTKESNIFEKIIKENETTILKITPSHIALINDVIMDNSKIHTFIVGGENLNVDASKRLSGQFENSVDIYNEYGPTEATIGCMTYLYKENESGSVPIGKPISNTKIYLLDQDMKPVPYDTLGEIYIGGDGVSKGYFKLEEETSRKFVKNPFQKDEVIYKSGDLACRDRSEDIIFYGRCDSEVKIRGNRVNLEEIKRWILLSGMVMDAFVKVFRKEDKSIQLCAYIVAKGLFDSEKLKEYLKEYLPSYMIPEFYMELELFPLTVSGKINVSKLPEPSILSKKSCDIKELSKEHKFLLNAVKEFVNKEVSLNDNFYAIGGDSIKAIQISSRLNENGYELSVQNILSYPVLGDMAYEMKQKVELPYEQGRCRGKIMKTPMVSWFFEQKFREEGHYNQSVLLELYQDVSLETLNDVFSELIKHHDMLRVNYDEEAGCLFYNNQHLNRHSIVNSIRIEDLGLRSEDIVKAIDDGIEHIFDLKSELLIKPYLLDAYSRSYLYITVHHLAIDGVSWRVLLDDIVTLLEQINKGLEISLPEKTVSYGQYAKIYNDFASRIDIDMEYWDEVFNVDYSQIYQNQENTNYEETIQAKIQLDQKDTEKLLGKANEPYNTKPNELLLIAFIRAINEVYSLHKVVLEIEGHGRDILERVNINRTVGWFTNMYPVCLWASSDNLQEQIKTLKEQIKKSYKRGYEYGILKYIKEQLLPDKRMIRFNYLGEYIKSQNDYFLLKQMLFESDVARTNKIPFLIDINAIVVDKELIVFMRFDINEFEKHSIESFISCFKNELKRVMKHCIDIEDRVYAPTDLG